MPSGACSPRTKRQRLEDCYKFRVSLDYREMSRIAEVHSETL